MEEERWRSEKKGHWVGLKYCRSSELGGDRAPTNNIFSQRCQLLPNDGNLGNNPPFRFFRQSLESLLRELTSSEESWRTGRQPVAALPPQQPWSRCPGGAQNSRPRMARDGHLRSRDVIVQSRSPGQLWFGWQALLKTLVKSRWHYNLNKLGGSIKKKMLTKTYENKHILYYLRYE